MSLTLTNVQQTEFDALVKAAYQSKGKNLISTVRQRTGFAGRFIDFRKVGSLTSVLQGFQDTVTPQDPGYTKVTLEVNKFVTPALTDELQNLTVNFDDRQENAELVADAVGRRQDQLIIDANNASGTANTIADSGTNFTYDKMREVNAFFSTNNVPPMDRHILISAAAERFLLSESEFINNEIVNKGVVESGTLEGTRYLGMMFHVIGDMPNEGGLPKTGDIRKCFAYHKQAVGFGMNKDFTTRIDWLPKETSWLVNGIHQSGSIAIDNVGIVEISIDESVI